MAANAELQEALDAFHRGDLSQARALAEKAVSAEPSALSHHLLGLIHCRNGEHAKGVEWLRRACVSDPDNPGFRLMLIRGLIDSGSSVEALELARRPSGKGQSELAAWHARAEAAEAAGRSEIAAEAWHVLCSARSDDWRAWASFGDSLARLNRWPEAATALSNATKLNPREWSLRKRYASALAQAGFYDKSVEQLRDLVDNGTEDTETRLTLARLYADLGRHTDAMDQFDIVASAVGGSEGKGLIRVALQQVNEPELIGEAEIGSVRELALLLERTNRMEELRDLLEDARTFKIPSERLAYPSALLALRDGDAGGAKLLLLTDDPTLDPVRRHALMARIDEQLGNPAGAFAEAEAMHQCVPDYSRWRRRAGAYCEKIERFAAIVNEQWAKRLVPAKTGSRREPAFLVGFPRSGTTLLDTFLRGHPSTEVVEEQPMLNSAEAVIGDFAELPERSANILEQARRAYFAELDRHVDPTFEGIVIDKLPLNMLGLPVVYSLFPGARIIFAQRHPCDVVLSCFFQAFTQNDAMACFLDLEDAARLYDAAMRLFFASRELLALKFHTIVYEDLVADPEATLRPAIDFLGLDWRGELLDHQVTAKSRGAINTPSYAQVVKPLSSAPAGRWTRYEEQLRPVLPVLLPWAERLGYPS